MMKARIVITPRKEVLDPQGVAVQGSLLSLGHDVRNVRVGRYVELDVPGPLADARAKVKAMCEELLANEVIEDFSFTVDPEDRTAVTAAHSEGAGG